MLTALDFPDELLYSREAIWLRDDGAGSCRIGLNAYVALGDAADVYFVRLPKPGARIARGEPFGHVDLGGRTVELVAPVSGKILFANAGLRAEPALLAREPYGNGFLLELDAVSKDEVAGLLERDAAVALYSGFAPGGPLSGEQRYQPGRPWASTVALRAGGDVLARGRLLPPSGNEVFTPDWVAGDTWAIDVRRAGATRRFAFEVLGDGVVADEEVTRVKAVEVPAEGAPAPAIHRVLHFRVEDHTLAAWDEVAAGDALEVVRRWNPRGREAWLFLDEQPDGFILDAPKLPTSLDDEARDIEKGDGPELFAISHYVKFRGGLTRVEAEMRADVAREDGRGTARLLSSQIIEKNQPWFTEATRMVGETEIVRARLIGSSRGSASGFER
jgi:glycine cleavage system H protein